MTSHCGLVAGLAFGLFLTLQPSSHPARAVEPARTSKEGTSMPMPQVVEGNNQFAADLYARLKDKTSENLFFSPYSISTALAMSYAGAAGETQKQMADVLDFAVLVGDAERRNGCSVFHDLRDHTGSVCQGILTHFASIGKLAESIRHHCRVDLSVSLACFC